MLTDADSDAACVRGHQEAESAGSDGVGLVLIRGDGDRQPHQSRFRGSRLTIEDCHRRDHISGVDLTLRHQDKTLHRNPKLNGPNDFALVSRLRLAFNQ